MTSKYEFTAQGADPAGRGVYTLQELHDLTGSLLAMGVEGTTVPKADYTFGQEIKVLKIKTEMTMPQKPL